jgi:hypothetical protein
MELSRRLVSDADLKAYLFAGIFDHHKVSPSELYAMTDRQIYDQYLRPRKKDGSIVPPGGNSEPERFKARPFKCMTEHLRIVLLQLEATAQEFGVKGERDVQERVANLVRIFGMDPDRARTLTNYRPSTDPQADARYFAGVLGWDAERLAEEEATLGN